MDGAFLGFHGGERGREGAVVEVSCGAERFAEGAEGAGGYLVQHWVCRLLEWPVDKGEQVRTGFCLLLWLFD